MRIIFMAKKLDYNFILEQIYEYGYTLLSTEYINANTNLKVECPRNHIYNVTWREFNRGTRCPICYGRKKNNIENVKSYATKFGYEVLSKKYKRSVDKIKIKCPKNHTYEAAWGSFQKGSRCPICWFVKNRGENHPTWKGGISIEPYCEIWTDKNFKEYIKQRDNYNCLNPECNKISDNLVIHHIDYEKKNCNPKNLITVCVSCNGKANINRNWHTSWYQAILNKRYNYIYEDK
jgi:hypothetical protein